MATVSVSSLCAGMRGGWLAAPACASSAPRVGAPPRRPTSPTGTTSSSSDACARWCEGSRRDTVAAGKSDGRLAISQCSQGGLNRSGLAGILTQEALRPRSRRCPLAFVTNGHNRQQFMQSLSERSHSAPSSWGGPAAQCRVSWPLGERTPTNKKLFHTNVCAKNRKSELDTV